ncbi:HalOD1 output domain-containing protein [Halogeometricum sp. CBA1124]|uniref:HalOD1 output domain-containing protein n=1 Tax=Halogeometricum sp. CBA1124 TaxID=2668071 RepID=UPI00142ABEF0|nr:hypothetical protein [Halogeometricum sp. CBA1124]
MGGTPVTTPASGSSDGIVAGGRLDVRLVRRIARTLDRDPMDLPPLAWEVDLDALSTLATNGHVSITFEYEGCDVRIHKDGTVSISVGDADADTASA